VKQPIVIIGIGELASVFARAFLRSGHPVYPITRGMDLAQVVSHIPDPLAVLVAVGENEFAQMIESIPAKWCDRLVLIRNELLPKDWQELGLDDPTVISVWFEKKKGMDYKPLLPTPIFGPHAEMISAALATLDISNCVLPSYDDLVFELALKNVFVVTINVAGLMLLDGATSSDLLNNYKELARNLASDVIDIQEKATGHTLAREKLIDGFQRGLEGDPDHKCRGRSAPDRLRRAVAFADEAGLEIKAIRNVSKQLSERSAELKLKRLENNGT